MIDSPEARIWLKFLFRAFVTHRVWVVARYTGGVVSGVPCVQGLAGPKKWRLNSICKHAGCCRLTRTAFQNDRILDHGW